MEVHPGVFVSNIATEEWQADPEIGGGAEEHVLFDTEPCEQGCHGSQRTLINSRRTGRCPPPKCAPRARR